jgi:uncharacterized protein
MSKPKSATYTIQNLTDTFLYVVPLIILSILVAFLSYKYYDQFSWQALQSNINYKLLLFFCIGFFAQLVDSTLGMGYGATSTSLLLATGVPPALSSTGVHVAEMFTTGVSAISQHKFGNINKKLVYSLLIPGVLGSFVGAFILSNYIDGNVIKPYISAYMIILALLIIKKAFVKKINRSKVKNLGFLATFGGFMDAVGGGGWGPIVTSTLIGKGKNPRYTIGSVNAAEFAIAFASGVTFLLFGGIHGWQIILGLILGGVIASPLGAFLVTRLPRKPLQIAVGIIIIILSLNTLYKYFF